ncbi:hypothetical protein BH23VER1_BH23VER1_32140 [soil metagenome]
MGAIGALGALWLGCVLPGAAEGADPLLVLDLASTAPGPGIYTRIYGSVGNGSRGVPASGGYDCDGDGHADSVFSQIQAAPLGRTGAGEVTLVFGDGAVGGETDTGGFGEGVLKIAGDANHEVTGAEVWMDDVDGDGLGDLIIGRQNFTPEAGREGAGAITIVFGGSGLRASAAMLEYLDLRAPPPGVRLLTISGATAYDRLGIWTRTGDITGDGIADIVVGADEVDAPGEANRGAVYVIRGGAHLAEAGGQIDLNGFGATALVGHIARIDPPAGSGNYHLGATVQVADLDGNGRAEVIASATLNRSGAGIRLPGAPGGTGQATGGSTDGTVFVVWDENFPPWLWPAGHVIDLENPTSGDTTRIDGASGNRSFGEELLGGLDFSGDGIPDLFVGDLVAASPNGFNSGEGYVFYNAPVLRGAEFSLDSPPAHIKFTTIYGPLALSLGADTAAQGDFDGDGLADLAFGNPHDAPSGRTSAGSVHVLYGQPGGWPDTVDLAEGELPAPAEVRIARIDGAKGSGGGNGTGDTLCYSADAGDIDGDGRTDFIVNEMAGNGAGGSPLDVGNLLLISGTALLAPPTTSLTVAETLVSFPATEATGAVSDSVLVALANNGAASVTLETLGIEGPQAAAFSVVSDSGEAVLLPGAARQIELAFAPGGVGVFGAALVVTVTGDVLATRIGLRGIGTDTDIVPAIESARIQADHFRIRFPSQIGSTYQLGRSGDLTGFAPAGPPVQGTGGFVWVEDPEAVAESGAGFYRLVREGGP